MPAPASTPAHQPMPDEGRARVVVEGLSPIVDNGRFAAKRVIGDRVAIEADVFTDGHDLVACAALYRHASDSSWQRVPMELVQNDRWRATFTATQLGRYVFTVEGWIDRFGTWARDLSKRVDAGQDVSVALEVGARLVEEAASDESDSCVRLRTLAARLRGEDSVAVATALSPELADLMAACARPEFVTRIDATYPIEVDRERARYSSWYELFPRSAADQPGRHGTLRDVGERLGYVAGMGFDVLYLPPIHPIGRSHRKGPNNSVVARPEDPGSPWAIGGVEGGHTAIHPELGTIEDFDRLVAQAAARGIEIALDLAFQCSPDHPYVREHPEWFRHLPDGSIQYAENPPKKYQDIYPFDFECDAWRELWAELRRVVGYWIDHGVRIFRVDNPHTKSFDFWEWLIADVRRTHPEVIFLAEAFTRPKLMYRLAKLGFTQSYTYFTWRNTPWELTRYVEELTRPEISDIFRPNFWPNTPDILTEHLQVGGRAAFLARVTLAATLAANYGVYGPAFELGEHLPREPGSEEYLDSEKYEIRHWDWGSSQSLRDYIARLNRIRRENPALQRNDTLRFHPIDNDRMLAYSKRSADGSNVIVVVVNVDPHHTQSGWLDLPLDELGVPADAPFQVHNLLSDARYLWHGSRNLVEVNPSGAPARIFRLRRRVRSERDFEYFL